MSKKKKTQQQYFDEKEEKAVIAYNNAQSQQERSRIYRQELDEPLKIMVASILRRYPIVMGDYDIEELELMGLAHVVEQMGKFKPNRVGKNGKPVKAYSYLGTIIRNYFRNHGKESVKKRNKTVEFGQVASKIEELDEYMYEIDQEEPDHDTYFAELFLSLSEMVARVLDEGINLRPKDHKVGEVLQLLLKNWQMLFAEEMQQGVHLSNNYVKQKMLFYLREQTGLDNKDIRKALQLFLPGYAEAKSTLRDF